MEKAVDQNNVTVTLFPESNVGPVPSGPLQKATLIDVGDTLDLEIFFDHSIIEVYVDGGAAVLVGASGITEQVQPSGLSAQVVDAPDEATLTINVSVVPMNATRFDSDPGPWNPQ